MAQFARPDSDISVDFYGGFGWSASAGSDLYAMIDEVVADDTDWAKFKGAASEGGYRYYKLGLSDIDEPSDKSTLSIRIRIHNASDFGDLRLYQGASQITRFNGPSNGFGTGTKRDIDFAIPESDANNITDYTDLNIWIGIDDESTGSAYVYQVYLEAGDAAGGSTTKKRTFGLVQDMGNEFNLSEDTATSC